MTAMIAALARTPRPVIEQVTALVAPPAAR
jgi:hypothetical protein